VVFVTELGVAWKTFRELIPHFLGTPFMSEKNRKDIIHVLSVFKQIMSKTGLVYWLDYGTLLGAYRWGDILPWDHDADISYMGGQSPILIESAPEFERHGMLLKVGQCRIFYENVIVDILPWVERDGRMIETRHLDYQPGFLKSWDERYDYFPSRWVNPVHEIYLAGDYYNCPNQVEQILRKRYGNINLIVPHRVKALLSPRLYKCYFAFARYQPRIQEPALKREWVTINHPALLKKIGVHDGTNP
jgi:hypothetical protein